jgi:hypothetical protein
MLPMFGSSRETGGRIPPSVIGISRHGRNDWRAIPQTTPLRQTHQILLLPNKPLHILPCLVAQGKVLASLELLLLVSQSPVDSFLQILAGLA